jgi:hypothetical protein
MEKHCTDFIFASDMLIPFILDTIFYSVALKITMKCNAAIFVPTTRLNQSKDIHD